MSKADVSAHHDDYIRPLDVRWLCSQCHRRWHAEHGPGANHHLVDAAHQMVSRAKIEGMLIPKPRCEECGLSKTHATGGPGRPRHELSERIQVRFSPPAVARARVLATADGHEDLDPWIRALVLKADVVQVHLAPRTADQADTRGRRRRP